MDKTSTPRRGFLATALLLAGAAVVQAQEAPKPSAEHQKLSYYVGEWTAEGELKANPFMPAGKYTSKDDCDWFKGGFAVVCEAEGKGPMGETESISLISYSTEEKAYTFYGIDSNGMVPTTVSKGTVQGDTWTFTDESKFGGKLVKSRYTIKHISPTVYTFTWEMQGEDGKWMALMEGKNTKTK